MRTNQQLVNPLNLDRDPFAASIDDGFFFTDTTRSQQLNMLIHLVQHSELLLLVTGVQGIGKSSLGQQFLALRDDAWRVSMIQGGRALGGDELLQQLCHDFGAELVTDDPRANLDSLRAKLVSFRLNVITPILLIDDAHELPESAIQLILQLADWQDRDDKLLRIILFSEPLTGDILSPPTATALQDRATHTLEIPPLSEAETCHYIAHRLQVAGWNGEPPFSPAELKRIAKTSRGIPARINHAARELLTGAGPTSGPAASRQPSDVQQPRSRAAMFVLALLGGAALLTGLVMSFPFGPDSTRHDDADVARQPTEPRAEQETVVLAPSTEGPTPQLVPPARRLPVDPVFTGPMPTALPPAAGTTAPPVTPGEVADAAKPLDEPPHAAAAPPDPEASSSPTRAPVADSGASAAVPDVARKTPTTRVVPGDEAASETMAAAQATDAPDTPPSTDQPAPVESPTPAPPRYREWLTAQDPTHLTVQLMGARTRAPIEQMLSKHGLSEQAYVVPERRRGGDWFVAVLGTYARVEEARTAIAGLPSEIRAQQPWPRRIGTLAPPVEAPTASRPAALTESGSISSRQDGPRGEHWLLTQDPTHYTIMLLGTRSEQALLKYVNAHSLKASGAYFRTLYKGGPWYVLLHGIYPTREAATKAVKKLPEDLGVSPWVRSLASVQRDIAKGTAPSPAP